MSALEPDELARLLSEAVEPVRPSPDAYRRIQAGVARRRRWRLPAYTAGGMVMAALIALAVVAIRPSPSNQVVEPAAPPVMPTNYTAPAVPGTAPVPGRSGQGGGTAGTSGGAGSASHAPTTTVTPRSSVAASTPTTPTASPSQPPASVSPPPGGLDSPQLPTPTAKPAGVNDIDGDGRPDTVGVAADGTTLQIEFSRDNQVAKIPLPAISAPLNSAVVDIDGDGFGELLVQTRASNGVKSYALLRYVSLDQVVVMALPDGLALSAGVRGNVATGLRCGDHVLQIASGTSTDGSQFTVTTTTLDLTVDGLSSADTASSTVRLPTDTSPFVASCGALS
ncbi:FG-GAP repeat domain-containing protein [Frankia sp. AgKG'84/4]|uniref:FG-GAP repeat domain-containing protein n=1 Tax=Frankia sp. AgKG'84/4 TaxID=573490 RepID=UPI00200DCE59|nr:VCBS repeat-containing protein [Frankia sp. AgKG'84/4]MCL9796017.1 FG-GAP-like repeat-containing protein [Frankia sp. AgKG'84/4]